MMTMMTMRRGVGLVGRVVSVARAANAHSSALRVGAVSVSTSTLPHSTFKRKTPYKGDLFVPAPDLTTPPPLYESVCVCVCVRVGL